ncbi:hypothetical protein PIB30_102393, partial [Stylosanthes scabra]|nr:hypothetical protein [Stylosanthes scabra]
RQSGRPGIGEGVCKSVCGRPGAQNWRLGVGWGSACGEGRCWAPRRSNLTPGRWVCALGVQRVCVGAQAPSFGHLGVSVVVQEGGVGMLGALGAQLFSCTFQGCFKAQINRQLWSLYIDAKPQMLSL